MMTPATFQQVEPSGVRSPRVLIAGIWMVPSCGGMVKTINSFRQALGAGVVSFTDGRQLDRERSAVAGAVHVRTGGDPLGRMYSWAPPIRLREADTLAQVADLISCHTLYRYHVDWVRTWARRRGLPYWVVTHGCLDPYVFTYRAWVKRPWMALVGRRHLREAHAIIFATRNEQRKAAPFLSRQNSHVVYWPVELPELGPGSVAARLMRESLGLAPTDRLLISLGRLHPMKRVLETVAAFRAAGRPNLHLAIAGPEEGVTYQEIQRAAQGDPRVHLLGPVWHERKEALFFAADGFVSLSVRENFGHSVAEAMGAGLPVILSPGNDLVGEFDGSRVGWALRDDSPDAAVQALIEFADVSPAVLRDMGVVGRSWVARELSFERFQSRLNGLALETMGAARSRSTARP